MQITSILARLFAFKRHRLLLALNLILMSFIGMLAIGSPGVHAAGPSDPQVSIVVDRTNATCFRTLTYLQHGQAHQTIIHLPCLPGTFLQTVVTHRSQAQALGEPYVLVPSPSASQAARRQAEQLVTQLMTTRRNELQRSSRAPKGIPCGATGLMGTAEAVDGTLIAGDVDYQRSYSCNSVVLDWVRVEGFSPSRNALWWDDNYYAGREFSLFFSCPFVGTNTTYDTLDASGMPQGFYFVFHFIPLTCQFPPPPDFTLGVGPVI